MVIVLCISISCVLLISQEAQAFKFTNEICNEYGLGKNWYCEEERNQDDTLTANDILESSLPPEQKAIKLNELWEYQRKVAVITGKAEDITNFLITQRQIAARGVDFARKIQHLIDTKPEFSSSESYYKSISDEAIKSAEKQTILQSSDERYALVFVYNSSCMHCSRQLPIIQKFKSVYKFKTLGITTDNNFFEGLDENIVDENVFRDPTVQSIPTILLLDKQNPAKIFISNGLITLDELESRIANRILEREYAKTS
jgi:conjugal transfer pilus assembly protein TraF